MTIPVIPSGEIASNIDADGLNAKWQELTAVMDAYEQSISKDKLSVLNKAISDWQDFYFGNMGIWDADSIVRWRHTYSTAAQLLATSIPVGAKPQTPTSATTQAKKTEANAVFYVTGKTTPVVIKPVSVPTFALPIDLTSPKWLGLLALGLPFSLYMLLRKRRRA